MAESNAPADTENEEAEMHTVSRVKKFTPVMVEVALYIGVFLITIALYFILKPYVSTWHTGSVSQAVIAAIIGVALVVAVMLAVFKKFNARAAVIIMMVVGIALRIGYMLYTNPTLRQMDTYVSGENGHEAYAWTIYSTGSLPSTNDYQFYHPPLNALIQALFMKIVSLFNASEEFISKFQYGYPSSYSYMTAERYYLYGTCQILSVMYSVITMVVMLKILKKLGFTGFTYVLTAAIVIFFPRQMQLSGQLNNDGLSYMLAILALYYAICWWKGSKGFGYIIACAFAVGLGMMTKMSSATICLPIAAIFIYEFFRSALLCDGALSLRKILVEFGVFIVPAAAIGLWFQVYAYVKFGQPFGYVFDNLVSSLYTGDYSVFERFIFAWDDTFYIFCTTHNGNYNLFNFLVHSAIFGEFSYWQGEGFALLAVIFAYVAILALAVALAYALYLFFRYDIKDKSPEMKENKHNVFLTFMLVESQVLSEIYFYVKMPYSCTMDFRYIMPMILAMAIMVGMVNKRLTRQGNKFSVVMVRILNVAVGAFLVSSSLFYMVCI